MEPQIEGDLGEVKVFASAAEQKRWLAQKKADLSQDMNAFAWGGEVLPHVDQPERLHRYIIDSASDLANQALGDLEASLEYLQIIEPGTRYTKALRPLAELVEHLEQLKSWRS